MTKGSRVADETDEVEVTGVVEEHEPAEWPEAGVSDPFRHINPFAPAWGGAPWRVER